MNGILGTTARRSLALLIAASAGLALAGCSILGNIPGAQTEDGTTTDVFAIKVGDCLNDASAGDEVQYVPIVECSEPHDSEAYYAFNLPEAGVHPGDEAVKQAAVDGCLPEFEKFVSLDYDESMLEFSFYYPTKETWANGDREILCIAFDPEGRVTGSLQGEAR